MCQQEGGKVVKSEGWWKKMGEKTLKRNCLFLANCLFLGELSRVDEMPGECQCTNEKCGVGKEF